jgi:uncharacterized repeat protein (TIGR03803 family)
MHKSGRPFVLFVSFLFVLAEAIAAPAQTFQSLFSFDATDGEYPYASVTQGTDGNIYGTTEGFGINNDYGSVFKIAPDGGPLTTLYRFCSQPNCTDGAYPEAPVLQASDGNFYGTTYMGGTNTCIYGESCGTIFKITPTGEFTTLYNFCSLSDCADGYFPFAGLIQAADGNLYGTTSDGGVGTVCGGLGCGTVFKITLAGQLTTLYSFCSQSGCADGEFPYAAPVQGTDGNFYGTTGDGGSQGYGTVYKMTPGGTLTTLYSFCSLSGCADGEYPFAVAPLAEGADGNFYGTVVEGGLHDAGTVFKITPSGVLTTIHSFCSRPPACSDGEYPEGLIRGSDNAFYGATLRGGGSDFAGTVFRVTSSGAFETLYSFGLLGTYPLASPFQDTNGELYGTTASGGTYGYGTIWRLSTGLSPFVQPQPSAGAVGASVDILGTNLTGATGLRFNGTAAVFTVVSPSLITTTVPSGATTGEIQVTTSRGTLRSNVPFRVIQ